jgi:hypothetical protein
MDSNRRKLSLPGGSMSASADETAESALALIDCARAVGIHLRPGRLGGSCLIAWPREKLDPNMVHALSVAHYEVHAALLAETAAQVATCRARQQIAPPTSCLTFWDHLEVRCTSDRALQGIEFILLPKGI